MRGDTVSNVKSERASGSRGAAFPGGGVVPDKGELRIAVEKKAYAEVIGHAVLEPEVEVCGVLVGQLCEDANGPFLHITSAIRGEAAKQQGAQVTFTHDTWNHIHREMDSKHPSEQIVGWYHTHGGFGIFLSEMDRFIQRNFFSAPHQVAFVFDPLAGSEGFFQMRDDQPVLCRRHWVGGRERKGSPPPDEARAAQPPRSQGDLGAVTAALQKTANALQAMAAQKEEPAIPAVAYVVAALLGVALVWNLLQGQGANAVAPEGRPGALLLLERDAASGRAIGVEIHSVTQHEGPVYRDAAGRLYVAAQLQAPDGRILTPSEILQAGIAASATTDPPPRLDPHAPQPLWRRYLPWLIAASALLAAVAIAVGLLLRRGPRTAA